MTRVAERLASLKKADQRLRSRHGALASLQQRIETEGISSDDHSLYNDLLEWRAIQHELAELVKLAKEQ